MSFERVMAALRIMQQSYRLRPSRDIAPALPKDPLLLTEAQIRKWPIFSSSPKGPPLLTDAHIRAWTVGTGFARSELYDRIAIYLARGFHRSELDFEFCDEIVNTIHGIITLADESRPDLFWQVFLAFDSGEFYRDNDRSQDPIEAFTRPLIAKVIEQYSSEYPDVR
jgi:hypothetical protein